MTDDDLDAEQDTALAECLNWSLLELGERVGIGWRRLPPADDLVEPSESSAYGPVEWWRTGEPVQALLGVPAERQAGGGVLVARPVVRWQSHRTVCEPSQRWTLISEPERDLRQAVDDVATARRRSFRWCRVCRTLTPPEYQHERNVCMGCAERTLGVVH